MVNLHLPLFKPVALAASVSSLIMSLMSRPPDSCPHVAAGKTLPVNRILALREILAKATVLEFLGLVLTNLARENVEGFDLPAVYRIPRSRAVSSTSYLMPDFLRVSLISLARRAEEAITDPAPFFEERVNLSLVVLSLKCIAADRMLQKRVFASLCEENWAVSSTCTLVIVAGWLCSSTSLMVGLNGFQICLS